MSELIPTIKKFMKGEVGFRTIFDEDESAMIQRIDTKTPIYSTRLKITFDDTPLFEMMDIDDNDAWFYNVVSSGHYEIIDNYTAAEDFNYSNNLDYMDESNLSKMNQIHSLLMGSKLEYGDEKKMGKFYLKLESFSERDYNDLLDEYQTMFNDSFNIHAEKEIQNDLNKYFNKIGFEMTAPEVLETTAGNLVAWALKLNMVNSNLDEILKRIFERTKNDEVFNWSEDPHDLMPSRKDIDNERYNYQVDRTLDNILEKLTESFDSTRNNVIAYRELFDKISDRYTFGTSYPLPKNRKYTFVVRGVTPDLKINVTLRNDKLQSRDVKLSEENFNNLLFHPELFKLDYI